MRKNIFELALLIGLVFSLLSAALATETRDGIKEKIIRLHVIANSDSEEDQKLKLSVRDKVLTLADELTKDCSTIEETKEVISSNLENFEILAEDICKASGFTYKADAVLDESAFPTKNYDSFSLPAGKYEALRIVLGKGKGENWWCVLFPPLCVSAAECKLENSGLTNDEIKFITSDKAEYKFKFKLLEIIEEVL